ncbi:mitochondrial import inner membrane translocase subunit Tim9 [Nephila pilipes]|uniref:Mitochondrial import inner membrane translocase subunit n=1 Tax=Nephila pilipes TaxID=299642 RepID=A0A8X6P4E0_NEPPI|nr:mitochondrial import inner membrane translocase subunit Tim9 [Nephila pilipes]
MKSKAKANNKEKIFEMSTPEEPVISEAEQIQQFRDFLISYNKLSERCFRDCVHDFTVRHIRDKEDRCALNCMEKYMKMTQRISQRFQEFQIISNENAIAAAKKAGSLLL